MFSSVRRPMRPSTYGVRDFNLLLRGCKVYTQRLWDAQQRRLMRHRDRPDAERRFNGSPGSRFNQFVRRLSPLNVGTISLAQRTILKTAPPADHWFWQVQALFDQS